MKDEVTEDNLIEVIKELRQDVLEIKTELNKYKGFAGGIWFVFSCIGIFIGAWRFFHR
jgi:hypothetical protein